MFKHMFVYVLLCVVGSTIYGFEVGIRRTKCSLRHEEFNNPCDSLYKAVCEGTHCKCPPGFHESETLKICQKNSFPKSSGSDDLFDLPFDYVPDQNKNKTLPDPRPSSSDFSPGIRLTKCSLDKENFSDPCQSLYKAICDGSNCKCPTGTKESKTLKICQKVSSSKLPKPGGDDLFDLPFDYTPNADKNKKLPEPSPSTTPSNFVTGIRRTRCSLIPDDFNNPCERLYNAICDGNHCKCPSGTQESQTLKNCQRNLTTLKSKKSDDDDLFDLPFDYSPNKDQNKKFPTAKRTTSGFAAGIQRTKCSLSPGDFNDPCGSLYSAICDGSHCKCPTGTHESETLKSCQKGSAPKSSGSGDDDLFDLPFDYVPDKNKNKTISKPAAGDIAPGAISPTNTNTNNYPGQPQQPGGGHPQSGNPNQPAYPNQPYPNQPSYPVYPNQPYPNQPAYPNQPVYPNQPAYPNQPGYPPQPANSYGGGDPHIGEKAGGGIGGGLGLIIIIGLIYFCCKRGKGNNQIMDMLSKFKGGGGGGPMAGPFGGGGGGGYPMNQIRGQQIYASPTEQNSIPPVEGGKYDDAPPPYGFKS